MSIYYDLYWPKGVADSIATLQNANANTALAINAVNLLSQGYTRTIAIASTDNNSAATFTVNGIQNGLSVSENIAGPNNNTVETTASFDSIISITVNANVTNVTVGTGSTGFLKIIPVNTSIRTSVLNYSVQGMFSVGSNVHYNLLATLGKISVTGKTYDNLVADGNFFKVVLNNVTVSDITSYTAPYSYLLIHITASTLLADDLRVLYLQI